MICKVELTNFGPVANLEWGQLGPINLVIGRNDSGKTFILKSIYSAVRTLEEYKRGNEQRSASEILAEKLYWTFQADRIGELVRRGDSALKFRCQFDGYEFMYGFGKDTTKQISQLENHVPPRVSNSVFLPAKEVLSLHDVILKSRENDKAFGFDDTYFDLAKALRQQPARGKNYEAFSASRGELERMLNGKVEYHSGVGRWLFRKDKQYFPIGVTAEGVKKIAILDTLLGNRYLDDKSIIFMDEPESALHPVAISKLLDIVAMLAGRGVQFFIASHSYFVVKKLFLVAQGKQMSIPVVMASDNDGWKTANLKDGMPNNPIVAEAVNLYKEEVNLALG